MVYRIPACLISEDKTLQVSGMFRRKLQVLAATGVWFAIACFANTAIIRSATGARPLRLERDRDVTQPGGEPLHLAGHEVHQIFVIED